MPPSNNYTSIIRKILEDNPGLKRPLEKILRAFSEQKDSFPKQVTLCKSADFDLYTLNSLIPPSALRRRENKIIFIPGNIPGNMQLQDWLAAVMEAIKPEDKRNNPDGDADLLLGRLEMLFTKLGSAIIALKDNRSGVKKKISEVGIEKAFEHYQLILRAVDFLRNNAEVMSPAELGAKICDDSKAFKRGSAMWILTSNLLAEELGSKAETVMVECGITENPTSLTVTVFGPFICYRRGEALDWIKRLWELGEAATLNAGNLEYIDRIEIARGLPLISSENESPFNQLMRTAPSPALFYTAGFPNSAVKRFLSLITGDIDYFHWGDTDPEGLHIAAILNSIKPLKLYRCNIDDCNRLCQNLIQSDEKKLKRGRKLLALSDFPFRKELEFTLENGWLEQEAWNIKLGG